MRPIALALRSTPVRTLLAVVIIAPAASLTGFPGNNAYTQSQAPSNRIVLTLTEAQLPSINGQVVRWDRLDAQFRAIYTGRPQRVLYLRAHPSNDYRTVTRVVDLAKRRGITVHFLPYVAERVI
jgi:biopolymer transport protein ExbD